jgi:hypothetical protein
MTTATSNGAVTAPRAIGFLPCPLCGEQQARISLDLADFALHCADCDSHFLAEEVRAFIARWQRVLSWIDSAPAAE